MCAIHETGERPCEQAALVDRLQRTREIVLDKPPVGLRGGQDSQYLKIIPWTGCGTLKSPKAVFEMEVELDEVLPSEAQDIYPRRFFLSQQDALVPVL